MTDRQKWLEFLSQYGLGINSDECLFEIASGKTYESPGGLIPSSLGMYLTFDGNGKFVSIGAWE